MDADRTSTFENARRFERELNGRQREILKLLAKGRTSAEIAAALDMTFDGAKWNVSEILTKLGLSSREEAAEYWHWRQGIASRAKSTLRALVPAGVPMKLVAGGGLAAITVAVVVVVLLVRGSGPPLDRAVNLQPFRMEVSTLQRDPGSDFRTSATVEWLDARHYRTTIESPGVAGAPPIESRLIADGEWLWVGPQESSTYARWEIPTKRRDDLDPVLFHMRYGPTTGTDSIDALLVRLRMETDNRDPDNPKFARIAGDDLLLGRPVVIIEYGPLWNDSTPGKRAAGWEIHSTGVARAWIDPETMFILRQEADLGESRSTLVEVVSLEFGVTFEAGYFEFDPPEGR